MSEPGNLAQRISVERLERAFPNVLRAPTTQALLFCSPSSPHTSAFGRFSGNALDLFQMQNSHALWRTSAAPRQSVFSTSPALRIKVNLQREHPVTTKFQQASSLPDFTRRHLQGITKHYNEADDDLLWAAMSYRKWLAHYYNLIIPKNASVIEIGCGSGHLLAMLNTRSVTGIDLAEKQIEQAKKNVPHGTFLVCSGEEISMRQKFDYIIISDTLNYAADVQLLLRQLHQLSTADTRLIVNFQSALWRPIYKIASILGLRAKHPECSWLTAPDVKNLMYLSDWEPIKLDARILLPWAPFGVDRLVNRWVGPLMPWFCLSIFTIARLPRLQNDEMSVSVLIPARNEAGNIAEAVRRTPNIGSTTQIVFVEGHSKDDTWAQIQKVVKEYPDRTIMALQQSGEGKGNAVREGFAACTGEILMILDADLTVPPEELPKFYSVIASGKAEFANGVRLVYPMGKQAMPFLNMCANKFFSLAFSWLLGQTVKDTLCGTKVLSRANYEKIAANRSYFGEFDPFGDFDLLFGAGKLGLRISDVPIRYQDRTYGSTNIRRWTHGGILLRMLFFVAYKLKFV